MADITINRQTDIAITFQYYDTDGETPRTLVGATVYLTIKPDPYDSDADDSDALLAYSTSSHTDAAAGLTTLTLTDAQTDIVPGNYFYDIVVEEAGGAIYKATEGRCRIEGKVTNRAS